MGITLQDIRLASVESILECTKDDKPKPPELEEIFESASTLLCTGCRRLGIPFVEEFGGLDDPDVPSDLREKIVGREYEEGMLVEYQGKACVVTSLSVQPPKGFLEQPFAYDLLGDYEVSVGKVIPLDSRISSLSLIDASLLDEFKNSV